MWLAWLGSCGANWLSALVERHKQTYDQFPDPGPDPGKPRGPDPGALSVSERVTCLEGEKARSRLEDSGPSLRDLWIETMEAGRAAVATNEIGTPEPN